MFIAQGTVLVKQDSKSVEVWINPTCDYRVHHNGKDYTVFVSDDGNSHLVLTAELFEVDPSIGQTLVQCAIGQVKITLEIAIAKDGKPEKPHRITGLHVPAKPVSR